LVVPKRFILLGNVTTWEIVQNATAERI